MSPGKMIFAVLELNVALIVNFKLISFSHLSRDSSSKNFRGLLMWWFV